MAKKEDFKNLLTKMSVQKDKEIPLQKVVPTIETFIQNDKEKLTKIALNLYVEDWLSLVQFKNQKILEQKRLDYTISDAIQFGFTLLEEKYKIKRNREKLTLKRGRRNNGKVEIKTTSVDLPEDTLNFINDFLYHKIFDQQLLDYTRPEMFSEMVKLLNNKYN